jgi:serine/threonine-protein kinase
VNDEPSQGNLPAPVWAVVRKALAKRPDERQQTATAFVAELRDALLAAGPFPGPEVQVAPDTLAERTIPSIPTERPLPEAQRPPSTGTARTIYTLQPGDRIGDYQLENRLDEGDRTRVYHALDLRHDRHVALKLIGTEDTRGTRTERFRREARLLGRLHHAHIVPFLDFDSFDFVCFIVMPFLTGRSLATRIQQQRMLPLQSVADIVRPLAGALDYLHSKQIIHRDLKPKNVVFDERDNPYLADLGIAKLLDDASDIQLTSVGQSVGTPAYMSPEQWLGTAVTPATDQYSLGCIVYEMLTGEPPFSAEAPFALMLQHVREAPRIPSQVRPDLPPAIDEVLLKALEKDPAHRHADATGFSRALRAAIQATAETAPGRTAGHVFISYSREDGEYAHRLAERIRAAGLEVWIDARLEPSDRWWRKIVAAIDDCAAFIAIMSPNAADSKWVEREVLLADQKNKPAFPLLLRGEPLPIYVNTQYTDVTGERLPPDPFYDRLVRTARVRA